MNATDPEEEREPPAQPTPVTFPTYEICDSSNWEEGSTVPNFQAIFAKVMKPADISKDHVDALNIELCPPCPLDDLLPLGTDGISYLPPLTSQQAITATTYADATKIDPAVSRKRKDFNDRLAELRVDNDTAYRTLTRTLKNSTKAPKLAYMRKFWEGLESMSQYWDCSLDEYYEAHCLAVDGEKSAKRQRLDSEHDKHSNGVTASERMDADLREFSCALGASSGNSTSASSIGTNGNAGDEAPTDADRKVRSGSATPETRSATPEPRSNLRYKGRRTNTGRELPDTFRVNTVRAFIEGTVWPFQCTISLPRQMSVVQFGKLKLPVRQTAAVYRLPEDRSAARQGRLEGPMIAMQVRAEINFADESGQSLEAKSRLDLMRELGGLLQLAQERRREGKKEVKPGEGKWWTTKPRWGGGPGGEMEDEAVNSDVVQVAEELLNGMKEAKGRLERGGGKIPKRKTPALLWKELKCGSGFWDPVYSLLHFTQPLYSMLTFAQKTDYAAIGKEQLSQYDEVRL